MWPEREWVFFWVGKCIFRPLRHSVEMFMKPVGWLGKGEEAERLGLSQDSGRSLGVSRPNLRHLEIEKKEIVRAWSIHTLPQNLHQTLLNKQCSRYSPFATGRDTWHRGYPNATFRADLCFCTDFSTTFRTKFKVINFLGYLDRSRLYPSELFIILIPYGWYRKHCGDYRNRRAGLKWLEI
jgi:hypothetical protein